MTALLFRCKLTMSVISVRKRRRGLLRAIHRTNSKPALKFLPQDLSAAACERGKGNWYAVLSVRDPQTGKRKVKWRSLPDCKNKRDAQKQCASLITEISSGSFIQTSKTTLGEWIEHWISIGCPGSKRRREVGPRTIERYAQLLRCHVIQHWASDPCNNCNRTRSTRCMSA